MAADVKAAGLGEDGLVTVGRGERDDHLVSFADALPAEFAFGGCRPAEGHHRRPPAQHLFDRGGHQRRDPSAGRPARLGARAVRCTPRAGRCAVSRSRPPQTARTCSRTRPPTPAAIVVHLCQQDRHHVIPRMAALFLGEQVGVGVQVRHAFPGPRVRHPAIAAWRGPQRQCLPGHGRAVAGSNSAEEA